MMTVPWFRATWFRATYDCGLQLPTQLATERRSGQTDGGFPISYQSRFDTLMKRFIKQLLTILLALSLPVSGWASVSVGPKCAMQEKSVASSQSDHSLHHAHQNHKMQKPAHDCCKDQQKKSTSDMPCKSGQECQSATVYIAPSATVAVPPSRHIVEIFSANNFSSSPLNAVWRPPLHS